MKNGKAKNRPLAHSTYILEGILAEHLTQCALAVEAMDPIHFLGEDPKLRFDVVQGTAIILGETAQAIVRDFHGMQDATLRPKHRCVRDIAAAMVGRMMMNNPLASDADQDSYRAHPSWVRWVMDATEFLQAFHLALHEDTPAGQRETVTARFCSPGKWGDAEEE